MKLIPEQVKILRDRKKELLALKDECYERLFFKEREDIDKMGPLYEDDPTYRNAVSELSSIYNTLDSGEFISKRNFECIDVGTKFRVSYEDDPHDFEDLILVETSVGTTFFEYVSLDSEMGRAVYGKKVGDDITYTVKATGIPIKIHIDEIDTIRDHYEHFIREKKYDLRVRKEAKMDISRSIQEGSYLDSLVITPRQYEMLVQEMNKIGDESNKSIAGKKGFLTKCLRLPVVESPNDDTIGIGSIVTVFLTDGEKEEYKTFEFIHSAVSTELESDYVEKISTLGSAIYGKKVNDTFKVVRREKHLKGIIISIDNEYNRDIKRVR